MRVGVNNLITNVNVQEEYKKAKNHLKKSYIALAEKEAEIPNKKNLENLEPCIRSLKLKSGAIIESVIIESTPIKTSYIEGEIVDLTGLKVTAVYSNGATRDVTDEVKCTPKNGDIIKMTDTNFLVEMQPISRISQFFPTKASVVQTILNALGNITEAAISKSIKLE